MSHWHRLLASGLIKHQPRQGNGRLLLDSLGSCDLGLTEVGLHLGLEHGEQEPDPVQVLDVSPDVGVGGEVGENSDDL